MSPGSPGSSTCRATAFKPMAKPARPGPSDECRGCLVSAQATTRRHGRGARADPAARGSAAGFSSLGSRRAYARCKRPDAVALSARKRVNGTMSWRTLASSSAARYASRVSTVPWRHLRRGRSPGLRSLPCAFRRGPRPRRVRVRRCAAPASRPATLLLPPARSGRSRSEASGIVTSAARTSTTRS